MRNRWRLGLAVVGIATTFTIGASARLGLQESGDEGTGAPSSAPQLPEVAEVPAEPFAIAEIQSVPAPRSVVVLDSTDPWSESPKLLTVRATPPAARPKPSPLDAADPWDHPTAARSLVERTPLDRSDPWTGTRSKRTATPAGTPSIGDGALRDEIKRAVDAGDLERAAMLLEMLRAR